MFVYKEKKKHFYKRNSFVILCLGAEPSQFSWSVGEVKNFSPHLSIFFQRALFPEPSDTCYSLYLFPMPLGLPLDRVLVFLHFEWLIHM